MSLYDSFMENTKVIYGERDPSAPKLIQIDEHSCYFENKPNVIFDTSLTDPSPENAERCIKNAAYHMFIGLLKQECEARGLAFEDVI